MDIFKLRQVCPTRFREYSSLEADGSKGGILLTWTTNYKKLREIIGEFIVTVI